MNRATINYNFIDLFAGAGGLSDGFLQAGFRPVAHVEMNKSAARTLETRSAYYYVVELKIWRGQAYHEKGEKQSAAGCLQFRRPFLHDTCQQISSTNR